MNDLVVPVHIRDGEYVRLRFPPDITLAEAEKVARVILAYAAEQSPAPEGGDAQ